MNLSANVLGVVKAGKALITANSPILLVGAAIAGVVTTGVLAAKGGYKARGIIDEAELLSPEPLTQADKARLTWLCYAAPAVTGVSTIASVVGVHWIHNKRNAALAGLYAVTSGKLDDMREEAEKMLGTKKTQALNDALAQKAIDKNPVENNEVIILDEPSSLCMDKQSGRYFMGSVPKIEKAVAAINLQIVEDGDASLNDFYELLGLPSIPIGERFGWNTNKIDAEFGSGITSDGRTAVVVDFRTEPEDNLGRR